MLTNNNRISALLIGMAVFLSGCSVYKAASNDGVAVSDIEDCQNQVCFLSHGMTIIEKDSLPDGQYLEVYHAQARKSGVTYGRAVGYGALDVMTLGLWEAAGTPIEGALSNNRGYVTVKALYASKLAEDMQGIAVYAPNGNLVYTKGDLNAIKRVKTTTPVKTVDMSKSETNKTDSIKKSSYGGTNQTESKA